MRRRELAAVLLVAGMATGARAALGGDVPARKLTLAEVQALALERHRDIARARAYGDWVEGKYVEERAAALPHLTLTADGSHAHDDSLQGLYGEFGDIFPRGQDILGTQIGLTQAVYTFGKLGASLRAARVGIESARDRLRGARQTALRDATRVFYDILLARELAAIAGQNLEQKERHLGEARKRYELGTATDYDVLAAEVAVAGSRPLLIRSTNAVRLARDRLRFVLAEETADLDVTGSLEAAITPPPGAEAALAVALERRPDLAELIHLSGVRKELVAIARADGRPRLDFRAGYGGRRYDVGEIDSAGKTWNAGLYLSFPVFDGFRTRGVTMQARSDRTLAEIAVAEARDAIALEVRTSLDALEEAAEVAAAAAGTLAQAERLLAMAEKGFELGVKTHLEVEDAQLNVLQARGELARARRDWLVARTDLAWVMGALGEDAPLAAPPVALPLDPDGAPRGSVSVR